MGNDNRETLLRVTDLKMHFVADGGGIFRKPTGKVRAVDGISFDVKRGETVGLVGESGCGKSTVIRAIAQLYRPTSGSVLFEGQELTQLGKNDLLSARQDMQVVFQDPYASLNPRMTIGDTIAEPLHVYRFRKLIRMSRHDVAKRVNELLDIVGLSRNYRNRYPHEFSGGQRQRVGIARALALRPKLILADEPVSALDVSIQAQVLNLLRELQKEFNLAYLFISHDLAVIKYISNRVAVMYLGKIVEMSKADVLYKNPLHPYTKALLSAIPIPDPEANSKRARIILEGDVPSPTQKQSGCYFYGRCPEKMAHCEHVIPPLIEVEPKHSVACHLHPAPEAPRNERSTAQPADSS